jgi:hypothetical protein
MKLRVTYNLELRDDCTGIEDANASILRDLNILYARSFFYKLLSVSTEPLPLVKADNSCIHCLIMDAIATSHSNETLETLPVHFGQVMGEVLLCAPIDVDRKDMAASFIVLYSYALCEAAKLS